MNSKPYIGLTGPTQETHVSSICKAFEDNGLYGNPHCRPMIGILASWKTLNGIPVENRRYPPVEKISKLLWKMRGGTFGTIHYNTRNMDTLSDQVSRLIQEPYNKALVQGLQMNMTYPPLKEVEKIKKRFPNLELIFQVNGEILGIKTRTQIAESLQDYSGMVDYVLIDGSDGKRKELDVDYSVKLAEKINELNPSFTIGFAGGLEESNVYENCKDLQRGYTKWFSIDAEGGIRDKKSEKYGDDTLNLKKARDYIEKASKFVKSLEV